MAVNNQKLLQQMVKLDGEFKGLRAQFTEFKKRVESGAASPKSSEPGESWRWSEAVSGASRIPTDPQLRHELDKLLRDLLKEREERLSTQKGMATRHDALKDELKHCKQQVHQLAHDFKKHKKEVEDTRHGTKDFPHQKLQAVSNEFHTFQKRIFDSGVLQPKIEKPPPEEPEPVGTLELGQDVYSARMLLRLGIKQAQHGARSLYAPGALSDDDLEESPPVKSKVYAEDSDSVLSVSSNDSNKEVLSGLPMIDVRQGERGYFSLTTGFLLVCIFTNLLQFAAVGNIIAYGLLHADNCLERPLTDLNWYNIHISKFFGMMVVGCFMSGDVMDTVNFVLVEILLEPKPALEVYIFACFRILFILLVTVANGVLFIIATSPDGVWLYITAVEFVNALSRAMVEMSKSGIWGKAISKELTDMNFTLCFQHDYPWWFQPVRFLSHLILFGLIGAFACYAFLMPIQICPSDGTDAQNVFLHPPSLFY